MKAQVREIRHRFDRLKMTVHEILPIIDMALGDHGELRTELSPYEVFDGVSDLIDRTVHGCSIGRFRPKGGRHPFHTFEIHTEGGDVLGYLNMVYSRRPIPCYYLVYVEVLVHFRGRGLGCSILRAYKKFAESRKAVALLDNIIPPDDPTYNTYAGLGWEPVERLTGDSLTGEKEHYMAFVPESVRTADLRCDLRKVLFKVMKKRPVIDMYDNESMVKRTIEEFRSLYGALERLFAEEFSKGTSTPLMRFMFTKFVTKMLGFRRRISTLLGYTGGESLDQIHISDKVRSLPLQSFSLWGLGEDWREIWDEDESVLRLVEKLLRGPLGHIEELPLYRRPYLVEGVEATRVERHDDLTIADILDLGFDPTKLRELHHEGVDYMVERVSGSFLKATEKKREFLPRIAGEFSGARFRGARVQVNPPRAIIKEKGNIYILYRKVGGIHIEEALDQLRTSSRLKELNRAAGIDRAMIATVNDVNDSLIKTFGPRTREQIENLVYFVPWDLKENRPDVAVDITGVSLGTIWIF